jgi:O-antigen ligase
VRAWTGWQWHSLGWTGTLALTAVLIGLNLVAAILWQRQREAPDRVRKLQRLGLAALVAWFLVGGLVGWAHYRRHPELLPLDRSTWYFPGGGEDPPKAC